LALHEPSSLTYSLGGNEMRLGEIFIHLESQRVSVERVAGICFI